MTREAPEECTAGPAVPLGIGKGIVCDSYDDNIHRFTKVMTEPGRCAFVPVLDVASRSRLRPLDE